MSVNDIRKTVTTDLFEVAEGDSEFSSTYIFGNEDHTLGNALRYLLIQKSAVDFCGYSVPHPYEPKMNVRLQTRGAKSIDVLHSGLKDLEVTADLLEDSFKAALQEFKSKN
jgi:DNA-directed RNA polymerase I and III subunit RPAC2